MFKCLSFYSSVILTFTLNIFIIFFRNSPGLLLHEILGFCVPDWMVAKMKCQMQSMRTDLSRPKVKSRSSVSSISANSVSYGNKLIFILGGLMILSLMFMKFLQG